VGNASFSCHRNVLACISPYFKAMFTNDLHESRQQEISLQEVDAESVRSIIEFAYSGRIEISQGNAQSLLAAASLFQVNSVMDACAHFKETQLDELNCIGRLTYLVRKIAINLFFYYYFFSCRYSVFCPHSQLS
jgi:hypothetical protein